MSKKTYILAIDQGTTSSRAVVFDANLEVVASAQQEFTQHFPQSGWVEHDAEEIWDSVMTVCRDALNNANISAAEVASIGITNQRETTIVWDRQTGKPISRAIVWQDRRTAEICRGLAGEGHGPVVERKTGLRLDPYFSATKLAWILDHTEGAREKADAGQLAFGTVDTFVLWRLTGGAVHATDVTNASRTALLDIESQRWDDELLSIFNVPATVLPEVRDCVDEYGVTADDLFGSAIPIGGIAGDQQAALIGQCCFAPGATKSTYGTGCFVIANSGSSIVRSNNQLLSTIGYRIAGETTYAIEGSIFVAGSAIQWLRDGIGIIDHAQDTADIAESHGIERDVVVVPAFTGLGAPHWDPDARGAIFGLTRGSDRAAIVTATLQSIAYQTADLMGAMKDDGLSPALLRVDGGMVANTWFLQFLADVTRLPIERPANTESTVLGAAALAGLQAGLFDSLDALTKVRAVDHSADPSMPDTDAAQLMQSWHSAVARTRS